MKEEIDRHVLYFLILATVFVILFVISAFIPNPIPNRPGRYYLMVSFLIWGGWVGFILILVSVIKVYKDYNKVNSVFKLYLIGIILITFNLGFYWRFYYMVGYILTLTSLIGFYGAFFFLKKVKSEIAQIEILKKKPEVKEKTIPLIQKFLKLSLLSIILFIVAAFFPNTVAGERGSYSLGMSRLYYGGWIGFIIALFSTILVYINPKKINIAIILYIIGTILIGVNVFFFLSYHAFYYYWIGIIIYFGALIGFIISSIVLNNAKYDVLGIPKVIAISILTKNLRYCENCQKFVTPYKLSVGHVLFFVCLFCLPGIIFLIIESFKKKRKKCPTCKKKVTSRSPTPEEIQSSLIEYRQYILDKIDEVEDFEDFQSRVKLVFKHVHLNLELEAIEFLRTREWSEAKRRAEYMTEIEIFLKKYYAKMEYPQLKSEYEPVVCPECGATIGSDSKYCEHCGKDLTTQK